MNALATQPFDKYTAVPQEMKDSNSWLVYRLKRGKDGKMDKIPYDPATGKMANDPKLGASFEVACAAEIAGKYDGIGFYVEAPYLVIDIDACVDRATGRCCALRR